jgi:3-deoxy-D-manno-octulosonic-acid transferase
MLRTGKWRTDWLGRFGQVNGNLVNARNPRPLPHDHVEGASGQTLLIHAVSVGEINAIRRLVATLQDRDPDLRIVIATTTDTGYARACELFAAEHTVVRYPFDFSFAVNRFLDAVQPDAVALVELEVWPNFVEACQRRGIAVGVINGRLSERSFARYRLIRRWVKPTFAKLTAVGAQTESYAERFKALGARPDAVRTLDTMKWDSARLTDTVDGAEALAASLGLDRDRPIVVAGSTGPGEEQMLIDQCPAEAQLLLVPRKPERFEQVAALDVTMVRRTQVDAGQDQTAANDDTAGAVTSDQKSEAPRLFLLDTMGELAKAYALADVVVVGRSFNGQGGSDPIEPIALGKPVILGPDHANFQDVVDAFQAADGIRLAKRDASLGEAIQGLLQEPEQARRLADNGRSVIRQRQGATARYAAMIERLLGRTERPDRETEASTNGQGAAPIKAPVAD